MKTGIKIVILLLVCVLLGLWSPWLQLRIDLAELFNVEKPEPVSGLEVYALLGELQVYIDGTLQEGTASRENGPLFIDGLEPGDKTIEIIRVSDIPDAYWTYRDILLFEDGINTVISLGIGPTEEFSEGNVITAQRKANEPYNLRVITNVEDFQIAIDGVPYSVDGNEFTQTVSLEQQHQISIAKNGYEELDFLVLPESQEEREVLKEFIISVEVNLLLQPVSVQ